MTPELLLIIGLALWRRDQPASDLPDNSKMRYLTLAGFAALLLATYHPSPHRAPSSLQLSPQ